MGVRLHLTRHLYFQRLFRLTISWGLHRSFRTIVLYLFLVCLYQIPGIFPRYDKLSPPPFALMLWDSDSSTR